MDRNELVSWYFHLGYDYKLIVCFLHFMHGINISLRQLKRILKRLDLKRRRTLTPAVIESACSALRRELQTSSNLLGYRSLWRRIKIHHNISVPRNFVMRQLAVLCPLESERRRRNRLHRRIYDNKGPNFVWHVDGMDKLKPYGFSIHGCIDGKVLWLQVGLSNKNPRNIAWHFLSCVKELKGTPRLLRTDCGTENSNLSFIQPFLRRGHTDCFAGMDSFRYGKSVTNQRIEAWWSILNKFCTQFWRALFKELELHGLLHLTSVVHMDCLKFCFMHLIQEDLYRLVLEWNTHRVRNNRSSTLPSGHPDEFFYMPQVYGAQNYICSVSTPDVRECMKYAEDPDPPGSLEFLNMALSVMREHHLSFPTSVKQAIDLFVTMTHILDAHM